MSELRRITPERVREAKAKLGARVVQRDFYDDRFGCGCPIGIVLRAEVPSYAGNPSWPALEGLGITLLYQMGFTEAFDSQPDDGLPSDPGVDADYKLGREDGLACLQDLLPDDYARCYPDGA
jgi:hypothetical protein